VGRSGDPRKRDKPQGSDDGGEVISIVPGRDPDRPTDCLISWRGQDWTAGVEDVRATAVDLFTVAAYADMMMHMVIKVGIEAAAMSRLAGDLLASQTGRICFGKRSTIDLLPVGSTKNRQGLVLIRRGGLEGIVETATAREMGLAWLEAAEEAESNQLVTEALRTVGELSEEKIEGLFSYLRELRSRAA